MFAIITPILALLISISLLLMGNGLQGTLLPVRASLEAFTAIEIGILGSSYFLGFAGGCVYGPYIVRRVGHIRTFTAIVHVSIIAYAVHRLRRRAVTPLEEHISFSDAMRMAGKVSSVDSLSHTREETPPDR